MLQVPCCRAELPAEAFLQAVSGDAALTRVFAGRCPRCQASWEFQVRGGQAVFGFTYAAGSLQFEGRVDVEARGLCAEGPAGARTLRWGASRWPAEAP